MKDRPFITVIVPACNAGEGLGRCLDALLASPYDSHEVIVVDDGSSDGTAAVARARGVEVVERAERSGPAAARNDGARRARGEILFFVDADVQVARETVGLVAGRFSEDPGLGALFGSYDDDPPERNFLSQYKNLAHHYVHQHAAEEAATFWAGCGAVRREVFERAGGFDAGRYGRPSIEDIELGYRLKDLGARIRLDKTLQVKHMKRWTIKSLLRADILDRAVPWSMLMLERGRIADDLNLKPGSKLSSGLTGLLALALVLSLFRPGFLLGAAALVLLLAGLNLDFYRFLFERRGPVFAVLSFFVHILYYFYSGLAFVLCRLAHTVSGRKRRASDA
jgi:glycosyltransferase involved in cell wall biosynthesis